MTLFLPHILGGNESVISYLTCQMTGGSIFRLPCPLGRNKPIFYKTVKLSCPLDLTKLDRRCKRKAPWTGRKAHSWLMTFWSFRQWILMLAGTAMIPSATHWTVFWDAFRGSPACYTRSLQLARWKGRDLIRRDASSFSHQQLEVKTTGRLPKLVFVRHVFIS